MALDFNTLLTADQKRGLLEQRIQQFAAEAYQHNLNKAVAESVGDEQSILTSDNALTVLENAIALHQKELDNLDG